jgi:SNF2 family DNA or RNA helicase
LKTELKDFQKETINWMNEMEKKVGGGLLLNEPGTGKTVCCLGLTREKEKVLVVCPAGVVDNWISEIKKHKKMEVNPKIIKYHGANREYNPNPELEEPTIVITSYTVLANEWKAETKFLENQFDRIILDEAHYIRNRSSTYFKSCKVLKGTVKWIVTATPIFNKERDLYAYFDFLEIPIEISKGGTIFSGFRELRELVKRYSICKTKKELKITKNKEEQVLKLDFNEDEYQFYTAFREYSSIRLDLLYRKMKMTTNARLRGIITSNLLTYILRLKQCCNHPMLVVNSLERTAKTSSIKEATDVLKFYSTNKMVEEDCAICYERQSDTILECGHKFCNSCITQMTNMNHTRCPMCRRELVIKEITFAGSAGRPEGGASELSSHAKTTSSKIKELVKLINSCLEEKVVVVSQWTSMLDIAKETDELKSIPSIDLRGGMTLEEKQEAIRQFRENDSIRVCYLSLTSSAEGIDLTVANKMIFLDMWWNEAKMIQASDRIHRIGQKRDVQIYILQITSSIEEDIYKMAKCKGQLSNILTRSWKGCNYEVSMIENIIKSLRMEVKRTS